MCRHVLRVRSYRKRPTRARVDEGLPSTSTQARQWCGPQHEAGLRFAPQSSLSQGRSPLWASLCQAAPRDPTWVRLVAPLPSPVPRLGAGAGTERSRQAVPSLAGLERAHAVLACIPLAGALTWLQPHSKGGPERPVSFLGRPREWRASI